MLEQHCPEQMPFSKKEIEEWLAHVKRRAAATRAPLGEMMSDDD